MPDLRVAERARISELGGFCAALRPGVFVANEIEADRGADDVRLVHQVEVIEVSRLHQILDGETGEALLDSIGLRHGRLSCKRGAAWLRKAGIESSKFGAMRV